MKWFLKNSMKNKLVMERNKFEKAKAINEKLEEISLFKKYIDENQSYMAIVKSSEHTIYPTPLAHFIMLKDELIKFMEIQEEKLTKEFEEL